MEDIRSGIVGFFVGAFVAFLLFSSCPNVTIVKGERQPYIVEYKDVNYRLVELEAK